MSKIKTKRIGIDITRAYRLLLGALLLGNCTSALWSDELTGEQLEARLKGIRADMPITSVQASPVAGVYTVDLANGSQLHVTSDGKYLFSGDLYEVQEEGFVNIAERGRSVKRVELLAQVSTEDMVIFPASQPRKTTITVFTDVDCGYCRKLHKEVPALNEMGIEVRYLAFPRAGIGEGSYDKMVSTWCSKDARKTLTNAKNGKTIPSLTCDNPVADQYELGQLFGVSGTPAIIFEDGSLVPGYVPAEELSKRLGL